MTMVMWQNGSSITLVMDEDTAMTLTSTRSILLAVTFAAATVGSSLAETPKAAANLDPVCPVELSQLRIQNNKLIFLDRNSSGTYIKKIALGAAYIDNANVAHPIEVDGGWKDLHAGYVLESALDIKNYRKTGYTGWVVWPEKVLFNDGSIWQINHATTSCGLQAWKGNQPEPTQPPTQLLSSLAGSAGK